MVEVGKPVFSFGELLVLLDVEGVGEMSAPLPTPAEAAGLAAASLRGTAPCVEFHGACRFRTGLAHLYEAPHTELVVSPGHVALSITRFADVDIWNHMFEWVSSYLGDALALQPQGARSSATPSATSDNHRVYAGQGVIAAVGFTRPTVRLDSRDMVIELGLRRDEPGIGTLRRLLGVAGGAPVAPPDDGNWRELATSWPMHLECARHGDTAQFRMSAPHHDGQTSTANLCEEWCRGWLDMCASTGPGRHDRTQQTWDLGALGHASIVRGDGAHRRDAHQLRVPAAWLAG
jgi:hypothetical protein